MKTISEVFLGILLLFSNVGCTQKNLGEFRNPFNHVGEDHNIGLAIILKNFDAIPGEQNSKMQRRMQEFILKNSEFKLKFKNYNKVREIPYVLPISKLLEDLDVNELLADSQISPELLGAVRKTLDVVKSNMDVGEGKKSISLITSEIEKIEKDGIGKFKGDEYVKYYSHLAVAKYSARFWALDGDNRKFINKRWKINWWKVVWYDIIGYMVAGPIGSIVCSALGALTQSLP